MSDVKNFMGYLWYKQEENVITIGINEDSLEDFDEITSVELPAEGEQVEEDVAFATVETNDGPLDIYTPAGGTILEINSQVVDEPSLIQEDPYEEGWLVRIEVEEDDDEDEDEDVDEDDEDDDDEDYEEDEE